MLSGWLKSDRLLIVNASNGVCFQFNLVSLGNLELICRFTLVSVNCNIMLSIRLTGVACSWIFQINFCTSC